MLENLRWYIQHIINERGYLYEDDESNYQIIKLLIEKGIFFET